MGAAIGADSLGYLSVDGMLAAIDRPRDSLCLACFTGEYPIDLRERAREVRNVDSKQAVNAVA